MTLRSSRIEPSDFFPRELDGVKFLVAVVYLAGAVGNYDGEGAADVCLCRSEYGQSGEVKDVEAVAKEERLAVVERIVNEA